MSCETELQNLKEAQQDFIDAAFNVGDLDSDATFAGWLFLASGFSGNVIAIGTAGANFFRKALQTEEAKEFLQTEFGELCDAFKEAMNCAQNNS